MDVHAFDEQNEATIKGWDSVPDDAGRHRLDQLAISELADGLPAANIRYKMRDQIFQNRIAFTFDRGYTGPYEPRHAS